MPKICFKILWTAIPVGIWVNAASISVTIVLHESGCQSLEQVHLTLPIFYDDDNDIIYYLQPTNTVCLQFSVNG